MFLISTQNHEVMSFLKLTLTPLGGHKGQKGQNFKNLANCLKRVENWENVENSTLKHVFSPFFVILMLHSGLSQFGDIIFFKILHWGERQQKLNFSALSMMSQIFNYRKESPKMSFWPWRGLKRQLDLKSWPGPKLAISSINFWAFGRKVSPLDMKILGPRS